MTTQLPRRRMATSVLAALLVLGGLLSGCSAPLRDTGGETPPALATSVTTLAPATPSPATAAPTAETAAPAATPRPTDTATPAAAQLPTVSAVPATSTPARPTPTPLPPAPPPDLNRISLSLEEVAAGFDQPVFVTHAGDGSGRTFVIEKTGAIRLTTGAPYLNIRDKVLFYDLFTVQHELGLLGLAFHPNFKQNRQFFVHYTNKNQDHVIARYTEGQNGRADPASEKVLLTYPQPDINFVGGMLEFGTDGYLYIGLGTGTPDDPSQVVAQRLDNLYGKILRIDVDGGDPYGIPPDNPFVGQDGARPEIWAYGLRNPWRFSFDRATNDLYIGGPGEFRREWIHFVAGGNAAGLNFGWPVLEGNECWESSPLPCRTAGLELPILTYPRADGNCVVIGGQVYRGPSQTALQGVYLFGDYCSGRIWGAARDRTGTWVTRELFDSSLLITSFGENEAGEMFVTDGKGGVYRIAARSR